MANKPAATEQPPEDMTCGIVMPISAIDGLSESHWLDVRAILEEAITGAGFKPNLVSDAADAGVIHKRIVQNLYSNPIVVADVSCKNPNVMFELGMRLAFDKPTVIVRDSQTPIVFDTGVVEHITYPRDLRYGAVGAFKQKLADKVIATFKEQSEPGQTSTFMKNFGPFTTPKFETRAVDKEEFILEEMRDMRLTMSRLQQMLASEVSAGNPARSQRAREQRLRHLHQSFTLFETFREYLSTIPAGQVAVASEFVERASRAAGVRQQLEELGIAPDSLAARQLLRQYFEMQASNDW